MDIPATRLESDEEVRQALLKYRPVKPSAVQREPAPADDGPPLFHPTQRPATPLLTIFDDGADDGELVRIRRDEFTIGRCEGDLVIGHDVQMSARHAQLCSTVSKGKRRWQLVDLESTNGTHVRVSQAVLEHGQEFIVGKTRLRFEHPAPDESARRAAASPATRAWDTGANNGLAPAIVAVTENSRRLIISGGEAWLGKDAGYCQLVLDDDPFVSARHARVHRNNDGRWVIENNRSLNGVWLRIKRLPIKGSCRFMIGEQQCLVRIPR